jgi:hypothetical protein
VRGETGVNSLVQALQQSMSNYDYQEGIWLRSHQTDSKYRYQLNGKWRYGLWKCNRMAGRFI